MTIKSQFAASRVFNFSSTSEKSFLLTLSESEKTLKRKVVAILTGGRETKHEQQTLGGQPDICRVLALYIFFFMADDSELAKRKEECLSGKILCGNCKQDLHQQITSFIAKHQQKKQEKVERAKQILQG